MNSVDLTKQLIERAKSLQQFEVKTDLPENFKFNGPVPFDLKIDDSKITAVVYAVDIREATDKLNEYIDSCTQDED